MHMEGVSEDRIVHNGVLAGWLYCGSLSTVLHPGRLRVSEKENSNDAGKAKRRGAVVCGRTGQWPSCQQLCRARLLLGRDKAGGLCEEVFVGPSAGRAACEHYGAGKAPRRVVYGRPISCRAAAAKQRTSSLWTWPPPRMWGA